MTFERFSSLPYPSKLDRCNKAFQSLIKRQTKVNAHINVLHEHHTMQEIFFNMLQLDSQLRQTVYHLFDKDVNVKHDMHSMKFSPLRLKTVCSDVCKLLDYISLVPKTDSDIDVLFLTAHVVKESQIRFHKNYYISYDWDQIFKSKTPTVPRIAVRKQYDFTFLTSKELKAKYKELKKEMSLPN